MSREKCGLFEEFLATPPSPIQIFLPVRISEPGFKNLTEWGLQLLQPMTRKTTKERIAD